MGKSMKRYVVRGFEASDARSVSTYEVGMQTIRRGESSDRARRSGDPGKPPVAGFTLIELLVVIVILGFAAAITVPMMSSATSFQIRSASNRIAADLEYAKSMAISRGQNHSVVFDVVDESYQVQDQSGTVIENPVNPGHNYEVDFGDDSRLDDVDIYTALFDGNAKVTFDYLGSPFNNAGTALNSGTVTLKAGVHTKTVTVEPVTGFITISD